MILLADRARDPEVGTLKGTYSSIKYHIEPNVLEGFEISYD